MTETEGPLDTIPTLNYQSFLNMENYMATKQLIDQVLNEDGEYVAWKLQSLRTGGRVKSALEENTKKRRADEREMGARKRQILADGQINEVPQDAIFVGEVFAEQQSQIPCPRNLTQEEQHKLLITNLDAEQTNRFEVFHRTSLNKSQVKKLAATVINQSVTENMRVFLQAIGKVFAGEIIELALDAKQKWLAGKMVNEFHNRKLLGKKLKKLLRKLIQLAQNQSEDYSDSVDETESDTPFDNENNTSNQKNLKMKLLSQYNQLIKEFNALDVSVEKYAQNSPILPEHIREAWRLYQIQSDTLPKATWRSQGEGNGWMFR